jgi:hypothetical protein
VKRRSRGRSIAHEECFRRVMGFGMKDFTNARLRPVIRKHLFGA